jgi:hypothetical protein
MWLLIVLAGALVPRSAPPAPIHPPLPYVVKNACPFEGCVFRPWVVGRNVAVRTRRSRSAPIAYSVKRWDWVRGVTGISITYEPIVIRFTRDTQVPVARRSGDTLEVLEYIGEGFGTIWFDGRVIENADLSRVYNNDCDARSSGCDGHVERPGRIEWWVQVENSDGTLGWTDEADAFGNKDALGGPWEEQVPVAGKPVRRPRPRP